jgi:hypothetical protein
MVPATSQAAGNGGLPGKPHRARPCVTLSAAALGFGVGHTAGGDEPAAPGAAGDRAAAGAALQSVLLDMLADLAGDPGGETGRCGAPSANFSSLYDIDG